MARPCARLRWSSRPRASRRWRREARCVPRRRACRARGRARVSSAVPWSLPYQLVESLASNVPDLLERLTELRITAIRQAPLHFIQHARSLSVQGERHDARKAELLAIAAVEGRYPLEFLPGERGKAEAALLPPPKHPQPSGRPLLAVGRPDVATHPD